MTVLQSFLIEIELRRRLALEQVCSRKEEKDRLLGLKTYYYEALRHTTMRPLAIQPRGLKTYYHEASRHTTDYYEALRHATMTYYYEASRQTTMRPQEMLL